MLLIFIILGTYKHQEKFFVNCNFCVCFDGEVICSMSQCLPEVGNNTTGLFHHKTSRIDNTYTFVINLVIY